MEHQIGKIQQTALAGLKVFIDFCNKHDIRYCALGGTTLGAVRHKGFIPWDDDIDIGVPRKDYEKLISLSNVYPPPYTIECMELSKTYVAPFIKIFDERTVATEDLVRPLKRGVWLDVFPLDGTASIRFLRRFHIKLTQIFIGALVFRNKSLPQNVYNKMPPLIVATSNLGEATLISAIKFLSTRMDFDSSEYFVNMMGIYGQREAMKKSILSEFTKIGFCDTSINVPSDVDGYLTNLYGNYKKMPPVEKRVSHHKFIEVHLNEEQDAHNM